MEGEYMRVTVVLEYPVDPDRYPGVTSPFERAEIDRQNFLKDRKILTDTIDTEGVRNISVTPVNISL